MWARQLLVTTYMGLGIYAPIYLVSTILYRRKKYVFLSLLSLFCLFFCCFSLVCYVSYSSRRLSLRDITHRMCPDILRSSVFLGVFGFTFFAFVSYFITFSFIFSSLYLFIYLYYYIIKCFVMISFDCCRYAQYASLGRKISN